jgi:hypothetical protein
MNFFAYIEAVPQAQRGICAQFVRQGPQDMAIGDRPKENGRDLRMDPINDSKALRTPYCRLMDNRASGPLGENWIETRPLGGARLGRPVRRRPCATGIIGFSDRPARNW